MNNLLQTSMGRSNDRSRFKEAPNTSLDRNADNLFLNLIDKCEGRMRSPRSVNSDVELNRCAVADGVRGFLL